MIFLSVLVIIMISVFTPECRAKNGYSLLKSSGYCGNPGESIGLRLPGGTKLVDSLGINYST